MDVCSASNVCNGSTKVNYYANANQRSTLVEKKRKKGTMIIFPADHVTTKE